jgi:hypothetical protein
MGPLTSKVHSLGDSSSKGSVSQSPVSAGIFNLVREYFKLICYKKGKLCRKISFSLSSEDFVEILWSAKFVSLFYGPQAKKFWETLALGDARGFKAVRSCVG